MSLNERMATCVKYGRTSRVKYLIAQGASVNQIIDYPEDYTFLHFIAENDSSEYDRKAMAEILLNARANVNAKARYMMIAERARRNL